MTPKTAAQGPRRLVIDEDGAGQRVDNLLLRELKGVPRQRIYSMLRRGEVRVNGARVKPTHRLEAGAELRLPPVHLADPAAPVDVSDGLATMLRDAVVFEDQDLLVVDKPSGLAVHGGSGVSIALVEALRVLRPELKALELAHRIDRDTSGCVLLAKRRSALRRLHTALRERLARKRYLAIVDGQWPRTLTDLDAPLLRTHAANGERFVRVSAAGKAARTRVKILRRFRDATLLEAWPETGRTHQLRVHLAHAGHAILGDAKYAAPAARDHWRARGVARLCLHAADISVPDWRDDAPSAMRTFSAAAPPAFDEITAMLEAV